MLEIRLFQESSSCINQEFNMVKEVKNGSVVKIHYTGKFEDGKVFDQLQGQDTLQFKVGNKEVIQGLDKNVIGMKEGDKKTIMIASEEGYGPRLEELVRKIPRNSIPTNVELKRDMTIALKTPDGRLLPLKIIDFDDKEITVDLNHPLAGKKLIFDIELVSVE